jgi:uncharacterized protein (DUF1330 family)
VSAATAEQTAEMKMSAYLTTTIKVKDPESFAEYAGMAVPVINEHGGETIVMGGVVKLLAGQADHEYEVVIQFPDTAAVEAFYESDEYQALIPLRDKGADVVFKVIEGL